MYLYVGTFSLASSLLYLVLSMGRNVLSHLWVHCSVVKYIFFSYMYVSWKPYRLYLVFFLFYIWPRTFFYLSWLLSLSYSLFHSFFYLYTIQLAEWNVLTFFFQRKSLHRGRQMKEQKELYVHNSQSRIRGWFFTIIPLLYTYKELLSEMFSLFSFKRKSLHTAQGPSNERAKRTTHLPKAELEAGFSQLFPFYIPIQNS